MRNIILFEKDFFRGTDARKAGTNRVMVALMDNPKISSVLLDRTRQEEFFGVMMRHVGEGGVLDTDTLRAILGELYVGRTHISKGSVERIADALLTENRDPKYFSYPEREADPETK